VAGETLVNMTKTAQLLLLLLLLLAVAAHAGVVAAEPHPHQGITAVSDGQSGACMQASWPMLKR
jgi:hypothetical protein